MKEVTVNFSILATLEVPDNADTGDIENAIRAYAENEGIRFLVNDVEADVWEDGKPHSVPLEPNFL